MRRTLWMAVLLITLLLAGAGALAPRRQQLRAARISASAVLLSPRVAAWITAFHGPGGWAAGAASLAVLSGWAFALALRQGRRDPLRAVLRHVRHGADAAGIAQRTGLAQDALRTLLDPRVAGGRQRRRGERSSGAERFACGRASGLAGRRAWGRCGDDA